LGGGGRGDRGTTGKKKKGGKGEKRNTGGQQKEKKPLKISLYGLGLTAAAGDTH